MPTGSCDAYRFLAGTLFFWWIRYIMSGRWYLHNWHDYASCLTSKNGLKSHFPLCGQTPLILEGLDLDGAQFSLWRDLSNCPEMGSRRRSVRHCPEVCYHSIWFQHITKYAVVLPSHARLNKSFLTRMEWRRRWTTIQSGEHSRTRDALVVKMT